MYQQRQRLPCIIDINAFPLTIIHMTLVVDAAYTAGAGGVF